MKICNAECRVKQKNVNAFDLIATGIGNSLAVGAFVVFGSLIKNITGPAVLLSTALAGATALFGGVCFAESGAQFLTVDSVFIFSYSFSTKHVAFIFGWILILQYAAGAASVGKGITVFIDALTENKISDFMKDVAPINFKNIFVYFDFLSLVVVIIVFIILALGTKDSTTVRNIFTICNIVLVVSTLIVGFFRVDLENWRINGSEDEKSKGGFMPFGVLGVIKGAAIALYAFVGFDNIGVSGCEVKNRKKNLPIAILTTITCVFLVYIGIGSILTLMVPYYKLNENAALPLVFEQLGLTLVKWIVIAAAFFGFLTSFFGTSFPLPRVIQAMANDGLLLSFLENDLSKISNSKTTILVGGLLSGVGTGIFSFQLLVSLTVLGALCVYTILAINVILTRYSLRSEDENFAESLDTFTNGGPEISAKMAIKSCFSLKSTLTTSITEKIAMGNLILYCLSSIGLGVILSGFSDSLFKGSVEAVVPCCIFLCIILLSLFSLIRQPRLSKLLIFEVPFVPILPCLSIFLNILLMTTFDGITWILFSGWMGLGILFHFVYQCLNSCNSNIKKDSLYEINRSNTLKLNEAIWKINSEKKIFYEGAVNPVFTDESENIPEEGNATSEIKAKVHNEKAILQLKQAEIIQTAEMIMEERTEPLENEPGSEFVGLDGNSLEENNSVHWECVAEIHTEEEDFPQESIVLEIVDNTYNFLSEVSEESPKDNISEKSVEKSSGSTGSAKESKLKENKDSNVFKDYQRNNFKKEEDLQTPFKHLQFQEELFSKIKDRGKIARETLEEKISEEFPNPTECQSDDELVNFVIETLYEAPKGEMNSRAQNNEEKETKMPEEHNKIKEFKEKLNQLLKNQINSGGTPPKSFTILKSDGNDEQMDKKKSETDLFGSIKTLNKTQIRGKLEVLLAKGPPKRPSLRNRYMNTVKEDEQNEKEKSNHETDASEEGPPSSNDDTKADFVGVETLVSSINEISKSPSR